MSKADSEIEYMRRERCVVCHAREEIQDILDGYRINNKGMDHALDYFECIGPFCKICDDCDLSINENNICSYCVAHP